MTGESEVKLPEPLPVKVNRPFIFLIRDIPTETILFLGQVVNPTG